MSDKGEIWSTRIQRELLALTTDDAEASERTRSMLPPFCNVTEHQLDIAKATCNVQVKVTVQEWDILIRLDASLHKKPDGSIDDSSACYPFSPPVVSLYAGQEAFPTGSSIQNGDILGTDIDWTPSLHLADAIMNVALKVKESILQKEPFHPTKASPGRKRGGLASSLSKAYSKVRPKPNPKATKSRSKVKQPASPENVRIGEEINLLEEPWAEARGVYACKALRRPDFITDAIEAAEHKVQEDTFRSPTAMFRSFTKTARNVLTESFLMITETHIIEMTCSKLNPQLATVSFCIAIELMHKLKFRRHESVSLFFKPAPEDPLIYMCPDSGDAVHQIQAVLKRHGVKGKHTNAAAHRAISEAMQLVQEIQTKELALKHDPSVTRVNEIMDLYRQAAERFEVAGDIRHEEVVTHMRKFLALPLTTSILDGSFQKPEDERHASGEGEVLDATDDQLLSSDFEDTPKKGEARDSDKDLENVDNLLKEAQEDFGSYDVDSDGEEHEIPRKPSAPSSADDDDLADLSSDLDAMMKQADAELAALMSS
jgi:hypothetical protein